MTVKNRKIVKSSKQWVIKNADIDLDFIPRYKVIYREIKYPRIELKTGNLVVVAPYGYKKIKELLIKKQDWISKKIKIIQSALKNNGRKKIYNRTENEFKKIILSFISKYSNRFGISPQKVFYRKMNSKWASCSNSGNIIINKIVSFLPVQLIKYIIFHEMIHLKIKKHNAEFFNILKKEFNYYEKYEKILMEYWFKIQNIEENKKN
ncbi:MAG: M48 family metallopeptidase [Candidatus Goldbacteria bacterium]|nr:M48 family metallopeptidase [Candidatus Goldiibacteriota bacterium]